MYLELGIRLDRRCYTLTGAFLRIFYGGGHVQDQSSVAERITG